jgi:peptidoglycan hydrolase-like protein with peptidoglycan-binding domain
VTWPVVGQGSRGPDVTAVQWLLTHRGFGTDADGIFGPLTAGQVTAFQDDAGLPATGTVNAATWQRLIATVRQGDRDDAVRAAQVQLTKHGHNLTADGIFGSLTRSATIAFQRLHGLTADGIIGSVTWRQLTGTA